MILKALRLISLLSTSQCFSPSHALIYSLVHTLRAHCSESSLIGSTQEWTREGGVSGSAFHVVPTPVSRLSILIQNACFVIMKHLVISERVSDSHVVTTIIDAGGLYTLLSFYDENLSVNDACLSFSPDVQRSYRPQYPSQQKVLELFHAVSANKKVVLELFRLHRYDILFGFMLNGAQEPKRLVLENMCRILAYLPDTSVNTSSTTFSVDGISQFRNESDNIESKIKRQPPRLFDIWKLHDDDSSTCNIDKVSDAEQLVLVLRNSEEWINIIIGELSCVHSQAAAICAICMLLDFDEFFLSTILHCDDRHECQRRIAKIVAKSLRDCPLEQSSRIHHVIQCVPMLTLIGHSEIQLLRGIVLHFIRCLVLTVETPT